MYGISLFETAAAATGLVEQLDTIEDASVSFHVLVLILFHEGPPERND